MRTHARQTAACAAAFILAAVLMAAGLARPDDTQIVSAEAADAQQWFDVGVWHYSGRDLSEPDFALAERWFRKAAAAGHSQAMEYLADCLINRADDPDPETGIRLLRQAATADPENAEAMADLSTYLCFDERPGIHNDLAESRKWAARSAALGNASGQAMLAYHYYVYGDAKEKDLAAALAEKAMEEQAVIGLAVVAQMHFDGEVMPVDPELAFRLATAAAAEGCVPAIGLLARMFYAGEGTKKDYSEAGERAAEAAAKSDPQAQWVLGAMFAAGKGAAKDVPTGWAFLTLARDRLGRDLGDDLVRLEATMSDAERRAGERNLAKWHAKRSMM